MALFVALAPDRDVGDTWDTQQAGPDRVPARTERSIIESRSDDNPIFITLLVAESGCMMSGGVDQLGSVGVTEVSRSCTSWRANNRSVPRSKISSIDESCGTDLDRTTSRPGMPVSTCSIGTVTSSSTSDDVSPRDAV